MLASYGELAHVLEPWLYFQEPRGGTEASQETWRRWQRRFLD
jgi:hypothetical protein